MKHKEIKKPGLEKEFEIEVAAETLAKLKAEKLESYGKSAKIPGFRPGKIPMPILEQRYGKQVEGEILEKTVDQSVREFFEKNTDLRPAAQPKVEISSYEPGQKLIFKITFDSLPKIDIKDADIKKIKLEKKVAEVDEKEIKEALENIRKNAKASKAITTKRAAKKGDIVIVNFDGSVKGERIDGMKGEKYELELGSNSFIDTFEDQIIGNKAGDSFDVNVTFPKEYHEAKLSGQPALFKVDLLEIKEAAEAELNDDLAVKNGFKTLDELKEAVKKKLAEDYDNLSKIKLKQEILDKLADQYTFDIPQSLLEQEMKQIKEMENQHQGGHHEHGPDCNHKHADAESCNHDGDKKTASKKETKEEKELVDLAARRVRLGLLLAEIGDQNKIDVTQQELTQAMFRELRNYPGHEKEMMDLFKKNPTLLQNFRGPILENKVMDHIIASAEVKEKKVTIDVLAKA